jgi:flavin reductase (DIM6/NTAB) family NADH-FMN oxidoreductase RutF
MTFSANIPSADMIKETDYCGYISVSKVDKIKFCNFKVFYDKLNNAPLIEQYPVNLECKVMHILDLGSNSLVLGRIEAVHVSDSCLTDGKPDINKIRPLVFVTAPSRQYRALGGVLAKAHSIGEELKDNWSESANLDTSG